MCKHPKGVLCVTPAVVTHTDKMSQTIKKISVTYDAVNSSNTFTNGDILHGRVTVETAKDTKIDTLLIKFKGKAFVRWTERHGKTTHTYWDKEKYFTSEQYFIKEHKDNGKLYEHVM